MIGKNINFSSNEYALEMSLSDDIIYHQPINIDQHLAQGELLDDIDEYGFTPIIQCAIVGNISAAEQLLARGIDIDKPDVSGRTALHWAADNNNEALVNLLLAKGANPNAYNRGGQSVLVFPLLRENFQVKQALYQHGASLDFSQDFINAKLIGHRFELTGDVDIVTANNEYIELNYEGFILEFSIDVIRNSLMQFRNNYAARALRQYFPLLDDISLGFETAAKFLQYQHQRLGSLELEKRLQLALAQKVLILPVAYKGHAIAFIRIGRFWAKIDRGENSQREGTVNVYYMTDKQACSVTFIKQLVFQKQSENYVHGQINKALKLKPLFTLPLSPQIAGNCSWANVEAIVPTALFMMQLEDTTHFVREKIELAMIQAFEFYQQWLIWDKDRTLNECIQSFKQSNEQRQASKVAILGAILFQTCNFGNLTHHARAEKIIEILMLPKFHYVLRSYLEAYCVRQLTPRGNNLLKFLEDVGIDSDIGIQSIATQVKDNKSPT